MSKGTVVLGTLATAIGIAGVVVGSVALSKVESMSSGSSVAIYRHRDRHLRTPSVD